MSADTPSLADLTGMKLLPHQQQIIDLLDERKDEVIPMLIANMGRVNRSFGKLGQRASTAAEAARNFNAALQGVIMHEFDKKAARIEAAALRKRRVAVTYRRPTRADRRTEHAIRMNMRAERRAEMVPGFFPMSNDRITKAYQAARAAIHLANPNVSPMDSHNEAINTVRRQLPPRRRDFFELGPDTSKQATVPGYVKPNIRPKSARPVREEMARAA